MKVLLTSLTSKECMQTRKLGCEILQEKISKKTLEMSKLAVHDGIKNYVKIVQGQNLLAKLKQKNKV